MTTQPPDDEADHLTAILIVGLRSPGADAATVRQIINALAPELGDERLPPVVRATVAEMAVDLRQLAFNELRNLLGPEDPTVVDVAADLLADPSLRLGKTNQMDAALSVLQGGTPSASVFRRLLLFDDEGVQDQARDRAADVLLRDPSGEIGEMLDGLSDNQGAEARAYFDVVARARAKARVADKSGDDGDGRTAGDDAPSDDGEVGDKSQPMRGSLAVLVQAQQAVDATVAAMEQILKQIETYELEVTPLERAILEHLKDDLDRISAEISAAIKTGAVPRFVPDALRAAGHLAQTAATIDGATGLAERATHLLEAARSLIG